MQQAVQCDKCGNSIAADAPSGLCPNCLLRTAVEHGASHALAPFLPKLRYFGDYELLQEVARGGMGVVYRATQVSLDRVVAVKMMRPGLLSTEAEVQRFVSEARTAASLQHPNIVAIHEVGEFDGLHYFSMDFVEGPSLDAVVHEGSLASTEAARYVQLLAEAVQYAHMKGILHRDLKPSNVLLDAAGRPRITDFGVARRIDGDAGTTGSGGVIGTPAYMPPEQAAGKTERITAASDVYSLGAILYELLTGRPPFRGANPMETVRMVIETEPARPRSLNPEIDARVEAICMRCLAKDPARRFQSAGELADELKGFLDGDAVPAGVAPKRRYALVWGTVALLVLVLAWTLLRTDSAPPRERRDQVVRSALPAVQPLRENVPPSAAAPARLRVAPARSASGTEAEPASSGVPAAIQASVFPQNGSGNDQLFTLRYEMNEEPATAGAIEVDFYEATGSRHCHIFVDPMSGLVQLQANPVQGSGLRVSGNLGTVNRIENPVCLINLADVLVTRAAKGIESRLPVQFQPTFQGAKKIESWVWNMQGTVRSVTTVSGEWTVGQQSLSDGRN